MGPRFDAMCQSNRREQPPENNLQVAPKGRADSWHLSGEDKTIDLKSLVERARGGDVKAFVELTGRFQHAAYGAALALLHDFQLAEDVVQEAFVAAWSGLPGLAEPAAFPGWLRRIVRHQAFRVLRR
jgi:Sigma-70 region 2